jgi:hypothetical protein
MCGAPELLPTFGARTFPSVITTSVVLDLNEIIFGVDYPLRCTYRSSAYSVIKQNLVCKPKKNLCFLWQRHVTDLSRVPITLYSNANTQHNNNINKKKVHTKVNVFVPISCH